MFETIFKSMNTTQALEVSLGAEVTLLSIVMSLFLGLIISGVYMFTTAAKDRSSNFVMALVILPILVSVVIILVGNNVARAFSIAGVFALIRFRSVPGDSKDISFVFLCMAIGLTMGLGYLTLGVAVTVIVCVVIILIKVSGYGTIKVKEKRLKIVIPEDMNYQDVFDEILKRYTTSATMMRVKTTNLGTLYELSYDVIMKATVSEKDLIDELRCRNGNLTIQLGVKETNVNQL